MSRFFAIKYTLIIWICLFWSAFSQDDIRDIEIDNIFLNEIVLESDHSYSHSRSYLLLKKRVLKVYPYVDSVTQIMNIADTSLKGIRKKRISRRYSRKLQKKMMRRFGENITSLTRKEGVVLSKIIYREFGVTVYDLISKYRGSFQAFFWQRLAKLYNGDLKSDFNPSVNKEDMFIEYIINKYIDRNDLQESSVHDFVF